MTQTRSVHSISVNKINGQPTPLAAFQDKVLLIVNVASQCGLTPQYQGLLTGSPSDIHWNFEKFLINRQGQVVARFAPDVTPEDPQLVEAVQKELQKK